MFLNIFNYRTGLVNKQFIQKKKEKGGEKMATTKINKQLDF